MVPTGASLCPVCGPSPSLPSADVFAFMCRRGWVPSLARAPFFFWLSCAVRSQPCRGSVGGRGACDRIEGMLCHRARVSAGFRVRGMMLCHRASPRSAMCVRNDPCKVSQRFALLFSRGGSVALRAARVCALVCMGSRARPSFASGGPGRWVDEAAPLSVQLVSGWTSRRALHRVRKLSRRHSRCH